MVRGDGPVPIWQQVVAVIRRNIEEGQWPVDYQIPSERELCEMFQISRTTVRIAIGEAERNGWLTRIHGKGTYVARPKINQPLIEFTSFAETLQARGIRPEARLIDMSRQIADPATARVLGLTPGDEVVRFRTLGLGNGEPMALYDSLVPTPFAAPVVESLARNDAASAKEEDSSSFALVTELLATAHGWAFLKAEQSYAASLAQPEEARLLRVPRPAAILRVTSLFLTPTGTPVAYRQAAYRADKYQFQVTREMQIQRRDRRR